MSKVKKNKNSRAAAAKIIALIVEKNKSLREVLVVEHSDPFVKELCYGVLRFYFQLNFLLLTLTEKTIKNPEIKALLLIGLYQIFFLEKADYVVVSETVNAAKALKKSWATQFINAVLRNALRSRDLLLAKAQNNLESQFSHPLWFIEKIQSEYPAYWQAILDANNQHPPMTLRVNTQKNSVLDYVKLLHVQGIETIKTPISTYGVQLKNPIPVEKLPGFSEGLVSVQDEAAQLAALLLDVKLNQDVLDACAAPGGKTTHILEVEPKLKELVAVDSDVKRLAMIQENLNRLQLHAELVCMDIKKIGLRWKENHFDRILLDVPCSATGVIRRHPDIKLLRKASDLKKLADEQYQILKAVWPFLKHNGILLYVTCSIFPEENTNLVKQFLQETSDAKEIPIDATWGHPMQVGRQILPGENGMDGFYFARIGKM